MQSKVIAKPLKTCFAADRKLDYWQMIFAPRSRFIAAWRLQSRMGENKWEAIPVRIASRWHITGV
jgi:hypothetical protein